ncbi:hypothetical protein [Roseibium aggregatum]|uniref:GDSL-like lipase/acylhydrolase family protein n=1 Tax=Roseibium aggregatum TaxID=187304 RepID=A0A939EEN4_9HYPH|nr:hypothetical protein [Roseibium aggregatum]MBN9671852.1 hypothetical protein [Roseibium aggregatum]
MSKISYDKYVALLTREPAVDPEEFDKQSEEILSFSVIEKGGNGFSFELRPDPQKVEVDPELQELESFMNITSGLSRWRRNRQFFRRLQAGERRPVLVSEGDSWFQFPLLLKEVIDHLNRDYLIYSVGAAGDTAANMVFGQNRHGQREYMSALGKVRKHGVAAFLFSAAGNDIVGEDPETGEAALFDLLRQFNGNPADVAGHIDHTVLKNKIGSLRIAYRKVIDDIRADEDFRTLPIVIHGYDYVFPFPYSEGGRHDERNPVYARKNGWLGDPLDRRGIYDQELRRNLIKYLLDELYAMLQGLSGDPRETGVWLVDCRNTLPDVDDWNDEIHPKSEGFGKVADKFKAALGGALGQDGLNRDVA